MSSGHVSGDNSSTSEGTGDACAHIMRRPSPTRLVPRLPAVFFCFFFLLAFLIIHPSIHPSDNIGLCSSPLFFFAFFCALLCRVFCPWSGGRLYHSAPHAAGTPAPPFPFERAHVGVSPQSVVRGGSGAGVGGGGANGAAAGGGGAGAARARSDPRASTAAGGGGDALPPGWTQMVCRGRAGAGEEGVEDGGTGDECRHGGRKTDPLLTVQQRSKEN